jgi:chemotaxis protein CheX
MEGVSREAIAEMLREATTAVFATMLGLPCEPLPVWRESGDPAPVDGVVALVGIAGAWTGTGRMYCSPEFACRLAGALVSAEYRNVDAEVLDAVAEVANMIIGNLKTALETQLGPLGLGVPTVIYGRNFQARTASMADWVVAPFVCGDQTLDVRFSLMPAQAPGTRPAALRPEPARV